jgi:hypothetical protein
VCVAARPVGAPARAAQGASADPRLAAVRFALHEKQPVPAVPGAALVRYLAPAPPRGRFEVRAAAAVDPADPTHGWLAVEAGTPLGRSGTPLHLTILLDASDSMHGVPITAIPPLLDQAPGGAYRNVSRIEIARAALLQLAERLPSRADVSLVVFDRDRAEVLLRPTPATSLRDIEFALNRASQDLARKGARSPLETTYTLASSSYDPCADNRILLVTDDNDQMDRNRETALRTVTAWADRGLELWTLSVGQLGRPAVSVTALTDAGRGVLVYADTVSEAVEPLGVALRASGAAVRAPSVRLDVAGELTPLTGAGASWALPDTLAAGWRGVELYRVSIPDPAAASLGVVHVSADAPADGEWTVRTDVVIPLAPLADADPIVRGRVFAWAVGEALAGRGAWADVQALGAIAVREDGPARELQAWAARLGQQ